jgi:ribonuclease HI
MGIGVAAFDDQGRSLATISRNLGRGTNNIAEHAALEAAVDLVREHGWRDVVICSDSQVAVKQLLGEYAVSAEHLQPVVRRVTAKVALVKARLEWIPREQNTVADALSKRAVQPSIFPAALSDVVAQAQRAIASLNNDADLVSVMECVVERIEAEPESVSDALRELRLGRSRYSTEPEDSARLSATIRHGAEAVDAMEAAIATRSPATRLKGLRWAARGLAPALVVAKLIIEKAATIAYRQRNQGGALGANVRLE